MKSTKLNRLAWLGLPLVLGVAVGCGPDKDDSAAEKTEDAVENAGESVEEGAEEVEDEVDDATD